jgi:flagellar protein FliL
MDKMAKEEREEQQEGEQESSRQKGGSFLKWIIIGLVFLVIVVAAVLGGVFYMTTKGAEANKQPVEQKHPGGVGSIWAMEPFIVNLMDNNGDRYLKAVIQLELSDPLAVPELEQLKPKLRDNVLDLLSAKSYKDLMETGGKERLRDELAMRLSSFMTKGKVLKVYFTEFVIQ